jgi:deoxycytidylate deaminase
MPHCIDGHCPRLHENSLNGSAYDNCIAQHAEANALLWTDPAQREGATLVVNGPPCFGCAKQIASSGITKVVCLADESYADWTNVRLFLNKANIHVIEVDPYVLELQ